MSRMREIVDGSADLRREAVETLALAFQDDPALSWILADPAARRRRLTRFFDWLFADHVRHGMILAAPQREAVTLWRLPGKVHHHDRLTAAELWRLLKIFGPAIGRADSVARHLARRIQMLAGGPEILADVERMRAHPSGKRLLAKRPDLGAALSCSAMLRAMPEGSLGRALFEAMDNPYGVPGYMLAGLIYRDGFFDSFEISEDARYYLERSRWLHDLFHLVSGFAPNLAGEGLLIYFQHAVTFTATFTALLSRSWRDRRSVLARGISFTPIAAPSVGKRF